MLIHDVTPVKTIKKSSVRLTVEDIVKGVFVLATLYVLLGIVYSWM